MIGGIRTDHDVRVRARFADDAAGGRLDRSERPDEVDPVEHVPRIHERRGVARRPREARIGDRVGMHRSVRVVEPGRLHRERDGPADGVREPPSLHRLPGPVAVRGGVEVTGEEGGDVCREQRFERREVLGDLTEPRVPFQSEGGVAIEPAVDDAVRRVRATREMRVGDRRHLAGPEQQIGPVAVRAPGFEDRVARDHVHPRRGVEPELPGDAAEPRVGLLHPDDVGTRRSDRLHHLVEAVGDARAVPDVEAHHGEIDRLRLGPARGVRRGHEEPDRERDTRHPGRQPPHGRHGRRSIVPEPLDMLCGSERRARRPKGTREMASNGNADLAFVNGAVYTVDASRRWASAVAVSGGRIVSVGSDDDVRELVGGGTEVLDLRGRMLLPGFQDAHVHPPSSGFEMLHCNLSEAYAVEDYERIVAEYASAHPDEHVDRRRRLVDGRLPRGQPAEGGPGRRRPRPSRVPDEPGRPQHVGRTRARCEIAGVTKDTPDPADGWIVRSADGEPAGTLHEGAFLLVERHVPDPTRMDWIEGLRAAQRYLHSLGITAWQDAIVGGSYPTFDAYVEFAGSGELTARVVGALWWERHRGIEQIEELIALRERGRVGRFAAGTVKIMQDGVIENHTAAVLEPYLHADGRVSQNRGRSFVEAEELKACITRLDAEGFQVHVHAIGERGVREALDAFEVARATNERERPPPSHRPPPGRAPRRHPAVRGAGRGRERAAPVGRQRRTDAPPHDPVPRRPSDRGGSTRSRASCVPVRCSRWGATGRSRARTPCGRCTSP